MNDAFSPVNRYLFPGCPFVIAEMCPSTRSSTRLNEYLSQLKFQAKVLICIPNYSKNQGVRKIKTYISEQNLSHKRLYFSSIIIYTTPERRFINTHLIAFVKQKRYNNVCSLLIVFSCHNPKLVSVTDQKRGDNPNSEASWVVTLPH